MVSNKKRPVFLNLFLIRLPVAGVSSILHRITGVALVILLPFFLYALQRSLHDAQEFERVTSWFQTLPGRSTALIMATVFAQHFATGIRHLLLSLGIGMGPLAASRSAWATFIFTALVTLFVVSQLL